MAAAVAFYSLGGEPYSFALAEVPPTANAPSTKARGGVWKAVLNFCTAVKDAAESAAFRFQLLVSPAEELAWIDALKFAESCNRVYNKPMGMLERKELAKAVEECVRGELAASNKKARACTRCHHSLFHLRCSKCPNSDDALTSIPPPISNPIALPLTLPAPVHPTTTTIAALDSAAQCVAAIVARRQTPRTFQKAVQAAAAVIDNTNLGLSGLGTTRSSSVSSMASVSDDLRSPVVDAAYLPEQQHQQRPSRPAANALDTQATTNGTTTMSATRCSSSSSLSSDVDLNLISCSDSTDSESVCDDATSSYKHTEPRFVPPMVPTLNLPTTAAPRDDLDTPQPPLTPAQSTPAPQDPTPSFSRSSSHHSISSITSTSTVGPETAVPPPQPPNKRPLLEPVHEVEPPSPTYIPTHSSPPNAPHSTTSSSPGTSSDPSLLPPSPTLPQGPTLTLSPFTNPGPPFDPPSFHLQLTPDTHLSIEVNRLPPPNSSSRPPSTVPPSTAPTSRTASTDVHSHALDFDAYSCLSSFFAHTFNTASSRGLSHLTPSDTPSGSSPHLSPTDSLHRSLSHPTPPSTTAPTANLQHGISQACSTSSEATYSSQATTGYSSDAQLSHSQATCCGSYGSDAPQHTSPRSSPNTTSHPHALKDHSPTTPAAACPDQPDDHALLDTTHPVDAIVAPPTPRNDSTPSSPPGSTLSKSDATTLAGLFESEDPPACALPDRLLSAVAPSQDSEIPPELGNAPHLTPHTTLDSEAAPSQPLRRTSHTVTSNPQPPSVPSTSCTAAAQPSPPSQTRPPAPTATKPTSNPSPTTPRKPATTTNPPTSTTSPSGKRPPLPRPAAPSPRTPDVWGPPQLLDCMGSSPVNTPHQPKMLRHASQPVMAEIQEDPSPSSATGRSPLRTASRQRSSPSYHSFGIQLGQGSFGTVQKGLWRGRMVAIKTICVRGTDLRGQEHAMREAAITYALDHPNIIKTYSWDIQVATSSSPTSAAPSPRGAATPAALPAAAAVTAAAAPSPRRSGARTPRASAPKPPPSDWVVSMVVELCDADLVQALRASCFHTPERRPLLPAILQIALDIAHGMEHLHSRRIIHGDLKSTNVLLKHQRSAASGFVAKVADLGMSYKLPQGANEIVGVHSGTRGYIAPEVQHEGTISRASDVYSYGVVLWEVYHAKPAVASRSFPRFQRGCPLQLESVALSCLSSSPVRRPTFGGVMLQLCSLIEAINQPAAVRAARTVRVLQ